MNLTAERVVETIISRSEVQSGPVVVFWVQVTNSRTQFREELVQTLADRPIIPVLVRDVQFSHSNAIMSDLRMVIDDHEADFIERADAIRGERKAVVILLSRSELALPQVSSPTALPEWFPIHGGATVYVTIQDITWTADGPLNVHEARIGEICELLFALEGALLRRLKTVHTVDHNAGNALFAIIGANGERYSQFLVEADESRVAVFNPSAFRPSAREGRTLVGRLLRIGSASSPDGLSKPAKALRDALHLHEHCVPPVRDSLISVLLRSTNREMDDATRVTRNLLLTVYASAQFVTAASHADAYARYPIALLRSMSYDLRSILQALDTALDNMV